MSVDFDSCIELLLRSEGGLYDLGYYEEAVRSLHAGHCHPGRGQREAH